MQAAAEEGRPGQFERWLGLTAEMTPPTTPDEFLPVCGAVGLGRLIAEGRREWLPLLRQAASDPRWRVREGVAMGLQRWGDADLPALLDEMAAWARGTLYEQRAVAAGLCEPRLLKDAEAVRRVLGLLDEITAGLPGAQERKSPAFQALRKGLAYAWSVAAAALPETGLPLLEKWLASPDKDVQWIMRENLKKARLERVAPEWVARWRNP